MLREKTLEEMVDLTGIVPFRRTEGDADLAEHGSVQSGRARQRLADQMLRVGTEWFRG
jgi:hypothetical protein